MPRIQSSHHEIDEYQSLSSQQNDPIDIVNCFGADGGFLLSPKDLNYI